MDSSNSRSWKNEPVKPRLRAAEVKTLASTSSSRSARPRVLPQVRRFANGDPSAKRILPIFITFIVLVVALRLVFMLALGMWLAFFFEKRKP